MTEEKVYKHPHDSHHFYPYKSREVCECGLCDDPEHCPDVVNECKGD